MGNTTLLAKIDSRVTHNFISIVQLQQIEHDNLQYIMTGVLPWGWQAPNIVIEDNSKVHAAKKVTLALQFGSCKDPCPV